MGQQKSVYDKSKINESRYCKTVLIKLDLEETGHSTKHRATLVRNC